MLARVAFAGVLGGAAALGLGWPDPALADPVLSLEEGTELPDAVSEAPFPVWFRLEGLIPETEYLYTIRLRTPSSSSDYGSFWSGVSFTTTYQTAGRSDAAGTLSLSAVLKKGALTELSGIRIRVKPAGTTVTPAPLDYPFTPSMGSLVVHGTAYLEGMTTETGYVELRDESGSLTSITGVGRDDPSPWLSEPGVFQLTALPGRYRLRLLDEFRSVIDESEVFDLASDVSLDINPPPPATYSESIHLSELLPDPAGDDAVGEFVELENRSSDSVELGDWVLRDASGKAYVFPAGVTLPAGAFLSVSYADSKLSLNNSGDEVILLDPSGREHERAAYTEAAEGQAWAWDGSLWRWSLRPSPGAGNAFPAPPEPPLLSIAAARAANQDGVIRLKGVVTAPTGLLGSKVSYLQDATGGIQLYGEGELALAALVEVEGRLARYHDEQRLKILSVNMLGISASPDPIRLAHSPTEAEEGVLAQVQGRVTKLAGSTVWVGEFRVVFKSSLGWKRPRLHVGDVVSVTGIISQYSGADAPFSGYRLLPRFPSDFQLLAAAAKSVTERASASRAGAFTGVVLAATTSGHPALAQRISYPGRHGGIALELVGMLLLFAGVIRVFHPHD